MEHDHHPKEAGHAHEHIGPHRHTHVHRHAERKRLRAVILLTATMMVAEIVAGVLTGSLALLSDGFHMLTHAGSLAVSYLAIVIATRRKHPEKTFGYWRIEILSALFNGVTLLPIIGYILYEAYQRLVEKPAVDYTWMLIVAVMGLVVNLVSAGILYGSVKGDLNIRGAFIHMLGDTFSSVGVVIAAVGIQLTGWTVLDPIASVLIGLVILAWSVSLIRESVNILLEAVPKDVAIDRVEATILSVEGVRHVHDLHIWQITSKMYSLTAHVALENVPLSEAYAILDRIAGRLDSEHHITHCNLQPEPVGDAPTYSPD